MNLPKQTKSYISELAEKTGKNENEIIQLAVFYLYHDKSKFVISPNTGEMWLKEEVSSADDVVEFTDSSGKTFSWVQYPDTQEGREIIGVRLKDIRESAGLSQTDLAGLTGLKRENISRIELGKYSTGIDIINKIAAALNVRLDFVK